MSNPLAGWNIIPRKDLREMCKYEYSIDRKIREARKMYRKMKSECHTELERYNALQKVVNMFEIRPEYILSNF